jgi:electron transfer flavoprotein beta subunit
VHIVVLAKPVPDTTGQERLGPDGRLDRAAVPAVVNANDEYALEAALKLIEASPDGGEVTLLAMAPPGGTDTLRKALAMGATRAVLVTDPALEGSDALSTARVLAAALRTLTYDLAIAGADTSDGGGGIVAAGIATILGLPYLSYAARIEPGDGRVRVRRLSAVGYDVIEAPMPALIVATQALGEPRYPTLKGIMGARSKEIATRSLADLELAGVEVGGAVATSRVTDSRQPPPRGKTRVVKAPAAEAAKTVVDFLVERRIV